MPLRHRCGAAFVLSIKGYFKRSPLLSFCVGFICLPLTVFAAIGVIKGDSRSANSMVTSVCQKRSVPAALPWTNQDAKAQSSHSKPFDFFLHYAKPTPLVKEAPRLASASFAGSKFAALGVAPAITATKDDTVPDANGKIEPGEAINYKVTISNTGDADATGVTLSDTIDPNTTLVPGSVQTTPLAHNDSYSALGNVSITQNAANGLLANDADPDGVGPTITASAGTTSVNGGNVNVSSNRSFSYNPAPSFEGTDTFIYTLSDGEGNTDTGTVTFNVSGMIWFIDNNSAAAVEDGRLNTPLNSITNFNAGAANQAGDQLVCTPKYDPIAA